MRILRVEVERLDLHLIEPYTIAYETIDHIDNLLVRLVTDGPHVGLGIAAPDEGVTGEQVDRTREGLLQAADRLLGADALRRVAVTESIAGPLADCPSARAAIDQALFDLLGKASGLPAWRLLGGYRHGIAISATVFLCPPDEVVRRAIDFRKRGFRLIKLKGGDSAELDIERIRRVREAIGPDVPLLFDANQGYDAPTALRLVHAVRDAKIAVFEQPCRADELGTLRSLTEALPLPVVADESLLDLADAFLLARGDVVDMVNIKLAKVGGIDQALLINGVARAAGLEAMVGCMDECALSIAAGLAVALSRPNVEYADLDGHLDLVADPTSAALTLVDGVLYPSELPGFGLVDVAS